MMCEIEIREWRDQEKQRLDSIVNPKQRKLQLDKLLLLNAILQED